MKNIKTYSLLLLIFLVVFCKENAKKDIVKITTEVSQFNSTLNTAAFDTIIDAKSVQLYWLKNDKIKLAITNYGGRFVELWVLIKPKNIPMLWLDSIVLKDLHNLPNLTLEQLLVV